MEVNVYQSKWIMKKKVIGALPVQDREEQEELRRKYAGVELPRLDPQGDWITVEELRAILHKENEEFYKKLKCDDPKENKDKR